MTNVRATVIIPTHNHAGMLRYAAASALSQTVQDVELFIIGDGVQQDTRDIVEAMRRSDERVRFFDHPKGPRLGEAYRHAALGEARGRIICYLCDDDLWLPHHVETIEKLLADADLAHTLQVRVWPDGRLSAGNEIEFGVPQMREAVLSDDIKIGSPGLSFMAHTVDLYRRHPLGWHTTPAGIPTDRYMYRQLVGLEGCRAVSGAWPTALKFPTPQRRTWSADQRVAEITEWSERVRDPGWVERLPVTLFETLVRSDAAKHVAVRTFRWERQRLARESGNLRRANQKLEQARDRYKGKVARLRENLHELRARHGRLDARMAQLQQSRSIRWGRRLATLPVLGFLFKTLTKPSHDRR